MYVVMNRSSECLLPSHYQEAGECKAQGILDARIWDTGLAVITKNLQIYAIVDVENPFTIKLKNPGALRSIAAAIVNLHSGLTSPPRSWLVMKPEQSRDNQLTIYLSVMSGTVILVTQDSSQGKLLIDR